MNDERTSIVLNTPRTRTLRYVLEDIANEIGEGNRNGTMRDGPDGDIDWSVIAASDGVVIDRRQRLAAAALLCGFDLPQEGRAAVSSYFEASVVCPGLTTGDIPQDRTQGRRNALIKARDLIAEMLAEIDEEDIPKEG